MTWVAMTLGFTSPLAHQMASDPSEGPVQYFFPLWATPLPVFNFAKTAGSRAGFYSKI